MSVLVPGPDALLESDEHMDSLVPLLEQVLLVGNTIAPAVGMCRANAVPQIVLRSFAEARSARVPIDKWLSRVGRVATHRMRRHVDAMIAGVLLPWMLASTASSRTFTGDEVVSVIHYASHFNLDLLAVQGSKLHRHLSTVETERAESAILCALSRLMAYRRDAVDLEAVAEHATLLLARKGATAGAALDAVAQLLDECELCGTRFFVTRGMNVCLRLFLAPQAPSTTTVMTALLCSAALRSPYAACKLRDGLLPRLREEAAVGQMEVVVCGTLVRAQPHVPLEPDQRTRLQTVRGMLTDAPLIACLDAPARKLIGTDGRTRGERELRSLRAGGAAGEWMVANHALKAAADAAPRRRAAGAKRAR